MESPWSRRSSAAARSSLEDLRGRYHPVTLPGELSVVQGTRIPLGERHKLLGRLHAELEAVAASWGQEDRHRLRSVARMGIG